MKIPPGIAHIPSLLPLIIPPPAFVYLLVIVAREYLGWRIHTAACILALILSYPVAFVYSRISSTLLRRWRAKRIGALSPPAVRDSLPTIFHKLSDDLANGYPVNVFKDWVNTYGQTYSIQLTEYWIYTSEPAHVKAILASQFEDFEKGPLTDDQFKALLGPGIFNSDGDTWKFHRSMTRPFFSKERISDFEIFARHADETIAQLSHRLSEGYPVEFQDLAGRFTLDSATEFLFGKSVDSLGAGIPYPESSSVKNSVHFNNHPSNSFLHSFATGQDLVSQRGRLGAFWWLGEFWKDKVDEHRKAINAFVDPIIKDALARKKARVVEKENETFLDHMIEHTQDYNVIQAELINILVAGRDTTASTLTFAVNVLSQRPDIVKRLREELLQKVGNTRYPTYEDIRNMKYLRAFLNEVLRLYPIVPLNGRTSVRETTLPSVTPEGQPIYVPKGTLCFYSVFLLHRRTDLWGPDALEFDPDRFIDERLHKYLTPNPYIFVPFNAGPRICVGQQFAYNEVSFFLIRLLQRFDSFGLALEAQPESAKPPKEWSTIPGPQGTDKIRLQLSLTMMVKGGMWVRMGKAAEIEH